MNNELWMINYELWIKDNLYAELLSFSFPSPAKEGCHSHFANDGEVYFKNNYEFSLRKPISKAVDVWINDWF